MSKTMPEKSKPAKKPAEPTPRPAIAPPVDVRSPANPAVDIDVDGLGWTEPPTYGEHNHNPNLAKATDLQLLRFSLGFCDGNNFFDDPVEAALTAAVEDLETFYSFVLDDGSNDIDAGNSFKRIIQRLRVAALLHDRQRAWLLRFANLATAVGELRESGILDEEAQP